ncbi:hypothetical protein GP486_000229 [Trichoglossum hirsutum]|uniref:RINT-1 family protein n=1 Tax=Trichoglossum hirsutum TaxID=265104 RepID=A0A9P8RTU9_9PEZI|nr:hypothetical protein GP486_000229 [Trichoglossum hirsutum]
MAAAAYPKSILRGEGDVRVEDYLNDKLQTYDDLENLESLLSSVKNQHDVLTKQLREAETSLEKAQRASKSHVSSVLQQARALQTQRTDIGRRLLIVTGSKTIDEAACKFESSMGKLRNLDIAKGYVEVLKEVEELSTMLTSVTPWSAEARLKVKNSPRAALKSYARLQNLTRALQSLQPAAEGAAPHLVDYVEKVSVALHKQMKEVLENEFEELLNKIKWPSKGVALSGAYQNEWKEGVGKLLELQKVDLEASVNAKGGDRDWKEPFVLLPLEMMVKPLELRFKYHFDGNKPTNRIDKPEYFLSHVVNLLNTYSDFLSQYLGPVLHSEFAGSSIDLDPVYTDSTSAFITSLLPMLRRKISHFLLEIAGQPQLLSHFIHELISFDATLREWNYEGGESLENWKGLTWEVLVKQDWFPRWLQVEKEFALSRYQTIVSTKDAWEIDYDSVDPSMTKSTKSAIRLKDLLETITDKFHNRLNSAIEAYMVLTSSIARAVQGVSKEDQASLAGVGGLERLCRVYGSAEYLEKAMRDWSDDIFFLELWEELQERTRGDTKKSLEEPESVNELAVHTPSLAGSEGDTGGLFDESAGAFKQLRVRTEGLIVESLSSNMREALKPYSRISIWSSLNSDSATPTTTITPELDPPIRQLSAYLSFLSAALAPAPLRRIFRHLATFLQQYFWDYVLMRNTFSGNGAMQFSRDVAAVWDLMNRWLGEGQGEVGMRKLHEGASLLSLPIDGEGEAPADLKYVEERVFESNERAKEVLGEMGFWVLTESEARGVLERRVELAD